MVSVREYMPARRRRTKLVTLNVDIAADFAGFGSAQRVTDAHRRVAKHYASPWLLGPPPSEKLLELMAHVFTDDEADVVQHLPPLRPRSAAQVAKKSGRSTADVTRVLQSLATVKHVLLSYGETRKYTILPIVPGTFEMALLTPDLSTRNSWHKRFAELFEELWDSGFLADYVKTTRPPVRYLPVLGVTKTLYRAWPSDKLEELLDGQKNFAVGNCQCRMAMQLAGKGCDRNLETCVAWGPIGEMVIDAGLMRPSDRQEVIEIKKEAEHEGSVTWMSNEAGDPRGDVSCSCCGCCCHNLRAISEFDAPGMISKPHFMPELIEENCKYCGACERVCPMGAWTVGKQDIAFARHRCVGCGLCMTACKLEALEFKALPTAPEPESGWSSLLLKMAPGYIVNSTKIWAQRLVSSSPAGKSSSNGGPHSHAR